VEAFEIDEALAEAARANLAAFDNVTVHAGNAVSLPLPDADLIYVNAGVAAPAVSWLKALRPGGRLIFPWQADKLHLAALITREAAGFALKPLHPAGFIPCVGRSAQDCIPVAAPDPSSAWESRAVHLTADRPPDGTATAVYADLWFSSAPPERAAD
jgi:protein-L-isoaspartate(D-aspartate) O-methyltransferase